MVVAVLGSTGYAGMTLLRMLANHPHVDSVLAVSSSHAGASIAEEDPALSAASVKKLGGRFVSADHAAGERPEVVFSGLPHLKSAEVLQPFYEHSIVVDLSADFRIPDAALFERAYGCRPPREEQLSHAAYGIPELYRDRIAASDIIANPGCYPTAALMPLVPLVRDGLILPSVIINALSGISGAGRKPKRNLLFGERSENVHAYSPGTSHRHWAEIYHYLLDAGLGGSGGGTGGSGGGADTAPVLFAPHLVPIKQGIAATIVAELAPGASQEKLSESLHAAYADSPFVQLPNGHIPETRDVRNTNRCDIACRVVDGKAMLFAAIDNLHKGAAGQAVQNMNVRMGYSERAGLSVDGEF